MVNTKPKAERQKRSAPTLTWQGRRIQRASFWSPVKTNTGWLVGKHKLPACSRLNAFLFAFKHTEEPDRREFYFWEIADMLWNKEGEEPLFAKTKWSWKIVHHLCREKYLAIGGAGSCGKSYVCAGWGIINFLCSPSDTMVLLTSTDLGGARLRIFGAVTKLLNAIPNAPVKPQLAIGAIPYYDGEKVHATSGLRLIASDKSDGKVGKLIGIKANHVILIADELSDISPNIQTAAVGNLSLNPKFQLVALSNPSSRLDPFGVFSTPRGGWDSVNTNTDYEWRTMLNGLYIRINSASSPNIDQEPSDEYPTGEFYPYLPTQESIDEDLRNMGATPEEARKSREWRRFREAVFNDAEDDDSFYSEMELIRSGARRRASDVKIRQPVLMCGCDPSFSQGGDGTVMTFGECGFDERAQHSLKIIESVKLYEDSTNKIDPRNLQIANKIKEHCLKRGVKIEDFALDATGAGAGLADMLEIVWGKGFMRVQFGGSASSSKIKSDSKVTAKDRYVNKASEMFFGLRQYCLGSQLAGLTDLIASQMCSRKYEMLKGPAGMRLQVEPKRAYKARVGRSPDELDSLMVLIELARVRQMFKPMDPPSGQEKKEHELNAYLRNRRTHASFACDRLGFTQNL